MQLAQSGAGLLTGGIVVTLVSLLLLPCLASLVVLLLISLVVGALLIGAGVSTQRQARDAMRPTCCGVDPAVLYHGWDGSIQSFTFRNGVYAEVFRTANARKLIG